MAWSKDARALAAALFLLAGAGAAAQPAEALADEAADTKAAHEAYERGTRAFGQGSYSVAAAEFARADELRPDASALESALKAAILAEDPVLSLTLVERAGGRPENARVAAQVTRAKDRFADKVGRLSVTCAAPCSVKVGNEPVVTGVGRYYRAGNYVIEVTAGGAPELFAVQLPGGANMEWKPPAAATLPAGSASAGATNSTAPSTAVAPLAPSSTARSAPSAPLASSSSSLSPAWFGVGVGVTAVAAGLALGFGVDTLQQHDAFVANRTDAGAASGRDAELRTNLFLGVTAATAIATAILGYVTFRTRPAPEPRTGARSFHTRPATAWFALDPARDEQRSAPASQAAARGSQPAR